MDIINLGSRVVNTWLIGGRDGYTLIDTGYESGFPGFLRKLKKARIDPSEIKLVFLTHAHDDHAGFLNDILRICDAKVILHPKAVEGLKRGQNSFEGGCSGRLAYGFCLLLEALGRGEHRYPPIREEFTDRLVTTDSEAFKAMALPFRVMETPGHTADHISLLQDGALFCGDAAMNGFPSRRRVTIWVEDPKQFKASWERMLSAEPRRIYPGHGRPFGPESLRRYLPALDNIRLYPLKAGKMGRTG